LGGLTLQLFDGHGHTPGTLCVLLREARMLLLGDACNVSTFLFDPFSSSIPAYRETLLRLKHDTQGLYDRLLFSHGPGEGDAA
jgi:glyoxylase-like metal-dependent hydrolase (beta-lactamase superfamily II)